MGESGRTYFQMETIDRREGPLPDWRHNRHVEMDLLPDEDD